MIRNSSMTSPNVAATKTPKYAGKQRERWTARRACRRSHSHHLRRHCRETVSRSVAACPLPGRNRIGKLRYAGSLPELLQMAGKDGEDATMRHAVAMALAGGQTAEQLAAAAKDANDLQRLVLVVALGKQKSPLVAQFLDDRDERVVLEAARVIWDAPVPVASTPSRRCCRKRIPNPIPSCGAFWRQTSPVARRKTYKR